MKRAGTAPDAKSDRAVQAALIDLDGTLLDTAPDLAAAANATLAEFGLQALAPETVRDFVGQGIANLVRRSVQAALGRAPEAAMLEAAMHRFAEHYERHNGTSTSVYPGVREGLAALRARGVGLACVTNKAARFTGPLLAASGLDRFFDAVVTSDDVGRRKPDPEPFLYACRALGVAPADTVVIGDSANDALGARAAGCRIYLVPYGYREGRAVRDIDCDGIVQTLFQAVDLFPNQS